MADANRTVTIAACNLDAKTWTVIVYPAIEVRASLYGYPEHRGGCPETLDIVNLELLRYQWFSRSDLKGCTGSRVTGGSDPQDKNRGCVHNDHFALLSGVLYPYRITARLRAA